MTVHRSQALRSEYRYNGLNWRVLKRTYLFTGDQQRLMYYSANWQLLEEHIDDDFDAQTPDVDRHMQYIWGPRYIDDIIARRQNSNFGNDSPDITYEDVWYHLTDAQFSTVAIIDDDAILIERVSYDAYGKARHHRLGDRDGDGATTSADRNLISGNPNFPGYFGVGDLDRSGAVDSTDLAMIPADLGAALPAGRLSTTDNIIGYAGYVFNAEHAGGGLYTVRFKVYSPDLGRWITRDPIGYVDGMGLYEYVQSNPLIYFDPTGEKKFKDLLNIGIAGASAWWSAGKQKVCNGVATALAMPEVDCACGVIGLFDIASSNPVIEGLDCFCNVMNTIDQACKRGAMWATIYGLLTANDCFSWLSGTAIGSAVGGKIGGAVGGPPGAMIGILVGGKTGDAALDIISAGLQNLVTQGTVLPISQCNSCWQVLMNVIGGGAAPPAVPAGGGAATPGAAPANTPADGTTSAAESSTNDVGNEEKCGCGT